MTNVELVPLGFPPPHFSLNLSSKTPNLMCKRTNSSPCLKPRFFVFKCRCLPQSKGKDNKIAFISIFNNDNKPIKLLDTVSGQLLEITI